MLICDFEKKIALRNNVQGDEMLYPIHDKGQMATGVK